MTKKVLIIIIAVGVIFLGLMGGGFYVVVNKISSLGPPPQGQETQTKEGKKEGQKEAIGSLLPLEAFVVNLADPGGKRYLRVAMTLEVQDEKKMEEIKKRLPQIRHLLLMDLSAKKLDDVQTIEGKLALREKLTADLNQLLKEPIVKNIYFTEFVVQ